MLAIGDANPLRHIRRPYVNTALIALCVVVYALQVVGPSDLVVEYALYPVQAFDPGRHPELDDTPLLARLVTYAALHAGLLHLLGNLVTLWVFGDNVEDAMGHWRYALFFALCAAAGGVAEVALAREVEIPVVGASGAVCGVMGAYLLMHPSARVLVLVGYRIPAAVPAGVFVGITIALNLLMALAADPEAMVAWHAHLGGFAAGMALLPLLRHRDVALFQPAESYPKDARFPVFGRFHLNLAPAPAPEGASRARRVLVAAKAVAFFVVVTVLVESFVP